MTGAEALRAAAARLRDAGIPDPMPDARALLAHALDLDPARLTLHLPDPVSPQAEARLHAAIEARLTRQPVSQITGKRLFWGRNFLVTPDVLDPRPETEILVAAALEEPFQNLLDLGTGTGCILLTLLAERPLAMGTGADISADALAVAARNAQAIAPRARLVLSDWCQAIRGQFDLITSNPPYIAAGEMPDLAPEVRQHEPHLALTPGGDGLDAYRALAAQAPAHLAPGGRLMVEIGPTQGAAVAGLFQAAGLQAIHLRRDFDGRDRVVLGRKPVG
jgi:release factor glutamine methyltransferase